MEFVLELLLEIILEGVAAGATSTKVPMVLRVLCAGIIILLFLAVVALIVYAAVAAQEVILKAICILIAVFVICGGIFGANKKIKEFRSDKEDNND